MKSYKDLISLFLILLPLLSNSQMKLYLIGGQSNAVGQGDHRTSRKYNCSTCFDYIQESDSLTILKDPTGQSDEYFNRANTGSIAPAFAYTLNKLSGDSVIIVSAARGGSSCHAKAELSVYGTWATKGNIELFTPAIKKVKEAEIKVNHQLDGIIWLQGERDANAINAGQMTGEEYKKALIDLIGRFRQYLGQSDLPFFIIKTGFYQNHPEAGYHEVRRIQRQITRELNQVYLVPIDPGKFPKKLWMTDAIHYNQVGLNKIGETAAGQIYKLNR